MFSGMRIKTSVTIDEKVLRAIDKAAGRGGSRSRILEAAAKDYLARRARAAREARDLEILNEHADGLNREMEDVLGYQADT
jgi:metal-responsive CopG/Arc/MetJ family transcriptional regulator